VIYLPSRRHNVGSHTESTEPKYEIAIRREDDVERWVRQCDWMLWDEIRTTAWEMSGHGATRNSGHTRPNQDRGDAGKSRSKSVARNEIGRQNAATSAQKEHSAMSDGAGGVLRVSIVAHPMQAPSGME